MALAGALIYFNFYELLPQRATPHVDKNKENPQAKLLEEKATEVKEAWDLLVQKMSVAAHSATAEPAARPALRILEERGRSLCSEMQGMLRVALRAA
ncbi:KCNB2 [Symbiodinium necroappetens]|uniref:KCNB2 protein n=1 Tax=Symbiodinium necroappetens TaxID=1628268 RepID=A0A813CEL3_9DINO|nr:KCNB2 [Symbiodinium necroappetens]